MRYPFVGPLTSAFAIVILMTGQAVAQGTSFYDFSDWNFANESGQRAMRRGDLEAAGNRFRNAIEIAKRIVASDPRPLARTYTDYAVLLLLQGRASEAEPLALWALAVREERFGKESEQAAATLHVLALIASAQMQYSRAEVFLSRALLIWNKRFGPDNPLVAIGQNDLATLYLHQRKFSQAEATFRQVIDSPGSRLHDRAIGLIGLATLYLAQGQRERAESTDQQLLIVLGRISPLTYPAVAPSLDQYVAQLRKLGRSAEAQTLEDAGRAARSGENIVHPHPGGRPPPTLRLRPRST
jgi:tetratricopeptide (TPR) repeat protein